MEKKYKSFLLAGTLFFTPALFSQPSQNDFNKEPIVAYAQKDVQKETSDFEKNVKQEEKTPEETSSYEHVVKTTKNVVSTGIGFALKPLSWLGDGITYLGKKTAEIIPGAKPISQFTEQTAAVVGSVPDVAIKMTQNASDFVVDTLMQPHKTHRNIPRFFGDSFQQFGRLTSLIDPINDLVQDTTKAGGDLVAQGVGLINEDAGKHVQNTVDTIDGGMSVLNRHSRIIRRQSGLLGQGEYLKMIADAQNFNDLGEKFKNYYLTKETDNPDLVYAKEQQQILKKVEQTDFKNVSEEIKKEENKKSRGLLAVLKEQQLRPASADKKEEGVNQTNNVNPTDMRALVKNTATR